jgi:uncharacterized protein
MQDLPILLPEELRVLGVLIEKSKTTPDYYPLTVNAIVTACNQKSARNPVVEYDETTVLRTIDALKNKQLIAKVTGDGRSIKYRHTLAVKYPLDPAEVTVLGLLFLRGPLTLGELKTTSGRMYDFENLQEVQKTVDTLQAYPEQFVVIVPRRTGQKEYRYFHRFCDLPEESEDLLANSVPSDIVGRVDALEEEVERLKRIIDEFLN